MITRRGTLAGGLALILSAISGAARAASWVVLGTRTVDLLGDHDEIEVGADEGLYKAVRLHVEGNGILIDVVRVRFGNGNELKFELRNFIGEGSSTRVLDFPGKARVLKRVILNYAREPGGGQSVVTVQGLKA